MKTYNLADFGHITSAKELVSTALVMKELPSVEEVKALAKWTPDLLERFNREADFFTGPPGEKQDRSAAMSALAYSGAELGWSDEQIMSALLDVDDRWGKYKNRRDRDKRLVDFINRARQKHGYDIIDVDLSKMLGTNPAVNPSDNKLVWGFQDFVEADFHIEWMLDQLLAQGGLGLVTGFPGTGKTQFCLAMAAHLALGHERFLRWSNVGGSKKVMFLSLEMGPNALNLFMTTIGDGYGDKRMLNKNFLVMPTGTALPLDTKEGQAFLNNLLDEYMPDILFIDSLQMMTSKELNDELSVKGLLHYLATVRGKYKCAMVLVHHNRKKANDAQKKEVEQSDVYGSTFIAAGVDFILSLKTLNPNLLAVDMLKNRLGATVPTFEIARNEHLGFSMDLEGLVEKFGIGGGSDGIDI